MIFSAIVAKTPEGVIGNNNKLPWHCREDLLWFKKNTNGKPIIMGRKTCESIGKPLPNRVNIVVTRNSDINYDGCVMAFSIKSALNIAKTTGCEEAFIIGGSSIYEATIDKVDRLYITDIEPEYTITGDAHFPEVDMSKWKKTFHEPHRDSNGTSFTFNIYERLR